MEINGAPHDLPENGDHFQNDSLHIYVPFWLLRASMVLLFAVAPFGIFMILDQAASWHFYQFDHNWIQQCSGPRDSVFFLSWH